MNSRLSLTILMTVGFVAILGFLMVMHNNADKKALGVDQQYLQAIDTTLQNDFSEGLQSRQGNGFTEDLGF